MGVSTESPRAPFTTVTNPPADVLEVEDPDTPIEGTGGPPDGTSDPRTTSPPPPQER